MDLLKEDTSRWEGFQFDAYVYPMHHTYVLRGLGRSLNQVVKKRRGRRKDGI